MLHYNVHLLVTQGDKKMQNKLKVVIKKIACVVGDVFVFSIADEPFKLFNLGRLIKDKCAHFPSESIN